MKWNEPPEPIPSWLDPAMEVLHDPPKLAKPDFIVACIDACVADGCDVVQAIGVTANSCNETGYGQFFRGDNLGGWKITKDGAISYANAHNGQHPRWWRAPGNKAPGATIGDLKGGDPPWCYYRAFDSLASFFSEWLTHFVPKPGRTAPYGTYVHTGTLFWLHDASWFREMCLAGYKGKNTQRNPMPSVVEWESMCRGISVHYAQSKLGVTSDGIVGPITRAACAAFQTAHGLHASGEIDADTLAALASMDAPTRRLSPAQ